MPGLAIHLYFSKKLYRRLIEKKGTYLDCDDFFAGSILPDFTIDKDATHFYQLPTDTFMGNGFYVPDMLTAVSTCQGMKNYSLRIGVLSHLWLDKQFTTKVLQQKFRVMDFGKTVQQKSTEDEWSMDDFFSFNGLYRVYSECTPLLFEDAPGGELLNLEELKQTMPLYPLLTGVEEFDRRKKENWFDYLEPRIKNPTPYTGELISIEEILDFIDEAVDDFIEDDTLTHSHWISESDLKNLTPRIETLPDKYGYTWGHLRQNIVFVILKNPQITDSEESMVGNFIDDACTLIQEYRQSCPKRQTSSGLLDAPNDIAKRGYLAIRKEVGVLPEFLGKIYNTDYPLRLNSIFSILRSGYDDSVHSSKGWMKPLADILYALASINSDYYCQIVSYSDF